MEATFYQQALSDIRTKLEKRRGYAPRIADKLTTKMEPVKPSDVYNVAHGRVKNPDILKALIAEAELAVTEKDPSVEIISKYLGSVA